MKTQAKFKAKSVLDAFGKGVKAVTPEVLAQLSKDKVQSSANAVEEAPKKTSFLKRLGNAAGGLLKTVAPIAASFIPGVGPIASQVLSTLNDDEWFGEFKAAGATFNEMLMIQDRESDDAAPITLTDIVGAIAFVDCGIFLSPYWKDQLLPSVLAYVRDKTSNVLNATEQDYWDAVVNGSTLYAIYYAVCKYIDLASNLPLNIPNLTGLCSIASPLNYSMLVGIREALKGYLQSTIKLPYAWTEYLRWRFGTSFKSSNTGKPGLIHYDPIDSMYKLTPAQLESAIDNLKALLVATGRAVADIKLAYDDHQIRYDVEESHYDEKEFNLRCNFWSNIRGHFGDDKYALVYMDSRLDSSAALQAVTISTTGDIAVTAPIHCAKVTIGAYNSANHVFPYYDRNSGTQKSITMPAGWFTAPLPTWVHSYCFETDLVGIQFEGYIRSDRTYVAQAADDVAAATTSITALIASYVADTLEFHNLAAGFAICTGFVTASAIAGYCRGKSLAYDTAYITASQIEAIHRMALRNLFRGNYKTKVAISVKPEIKTAVADVVDTVKDEMIAKM